MVGRNGLLCLFLCYLVGFGRYERDKFDTAVNEEIACIPCEGDAGRCEDFDYDLLDGSYGLEVSIELVQGVTKSRKCIGEVAKQYRRIPRVYLWVVRDHLCQTRDPTLCRVSTPSTIVD